MQLPVIRSMDQVLFDVVKVVAVRKAHNSDKRGRWEGRHTFNDFVYESFNKD